MAKPKKKQSPPVASAPVVSAPEPLIEHGPRPAAHLALVAAILALVCGIIYWQTSGFEFINYDDGAYLTENPQVRGGLTAAGIAWAFRSVDYYYWHPLTWLSHMLDVSLFGMNAGRHHAVNMVFHMANAALLFFALNLLTGAVWRSAFAAALFAWHPLRVESVAWVAERKDLTSGFFWILTMLLYALYVRRRSRARYAAVIAAALCAMMSKPTTVTLPFALLLLDYWPLNRLSREGFRPLVREKLPLFAMTALVSVLTYLGQSRIGATVSLDALPFWFRIWNTTVAHVRYLANFFWPVDLGIVYPYSKISGGEFFGALVLLVAITIAALMGARRRPFLAFGWLWFLGVLFPMNGLTQSGVQALADRFTYLPMLGLSVLLVWTAASLAPPKLAAAAGSVFLVLLAAQSWRQTSYWRDSFTLFHHTVAVTKDNDMMHLNLGSLYERAGKYDEALKHYLEIIRIEPKHVQMHYMAGNMYLKTNNVDQAVNYYQKTLEMFPGHLEAKKQLAECMIRRGRRDEAAAYLRQVIQASPADVEARARLLMLGSQGK